MKRVMDVSPNDRSTEPSSSKVRLVERNPEPNGVALVNAARVATKSFEEMMNLEEDQILADKFLRSTLNNKLDVIGRQAKNLRDLMVDVISEAKLSRELNNAACNFIKHPGHVYHLYERSSGQKYLSMLSPEEWLNPPHKYIGSYRLELDLSWREAQQEDNYEGVNFLRMLMGPSLKEALSKSAIHEF